MGIQKLAVIPRLPL